MPEEITEEIDKKRRKIDVVKLRKLLKLFAVVLAVLVVFSGYEFWISRYGLETTDYTITTDEISAPFRIVQLTDLHDSVFGENNGKLVEAVQAAEPDVILITGDLINSKTGESTDIATSLITDLCGIAPVYVSYGNQEVDLENYYGTDITSIYTQAGAVVLERNYIDTEIAGVPVRIGGIYGYCQTRSAAIETKREDESEFLEEFQDTDRYTILMCHMPVCWVIYQSLYDWNIDVVFSGHAHGGQIRLPFIGGLWAPDQGWFPGQECGIYTTNESDWQTYMAGRREWAEKEEYEIAAYSEDTIYEPSYLVLSRGLGNTDWMPRFNNIPEVVSVDFLTGQ